MPEDNKNTSADHERSNEAQASEVIMTTDTEVIIDSTRVFIEKAPENEEVIKLPQEISDKIMSRGFNIGDLEHINIKFYNLVALKLIEGQKSWFVAKHLEKFNNINHRQIAIEIIGRGDGRFVAQYLEKFEKKYHKEIIEYLSKKDPGSALMHIKNYHHFSGLEEVVLIGFSEYIQNLSGVVKTEAMRQAKNVLTTCKGNEEDFGNALYRLNYTLESNPELWNDLIYPTIMSQKIGAFRCMEDIKSIYDKLENMEDKKVIDLLKFITTQLGIKAHDILKNFIIKGLKEGKIKDLSEESETIRDFLGEAPILLTEIYELYKAVKEQDKPELYREIVGVTNAIHARIAKGECEDGDFNNRFFPGILMHTFPPSAGIERSQYISLIHYRKDRQNDVPESLGELQGKAITVNQGGYRLKDGGELDVDAWNAPLTISRECKEAEVKKIEKKDMVELGRGLMDCLAAKKLKGKQKEYLNDLYNVYRSRGQFLPDSVDGYKELMAYKEYVGDHLNDIIGLCVQAWHEENPDEWEAWNKKEKERRGGSIKGLIKQLVGVIQNEKMNDEKKMEVLKRILIKADFRVEGDVLNILSVELSRDNLREFLMDRMESGSSQKYNLMIKNALLGKEYEQMYEEMQKFEFVEGVEKQDYELIVSKKREHGCVGLNMGVCVAEDEKLWKNPNFMNVIIMKNNIAYGGMHFLVIEEAGTKYLTLPGINPNEAILGQVAADDLFDEMMNYAKACAEKMGCERVLIQVNPLIHSNRSAIQQVIASRGYKTFEFSEKKLFSHRPYKYDFQECFVVE